MLAGLVGIYAAGFSDLTDKPMAVNGDQLGQDSGESAASYQERAMLSLSRIADEEPHWALVTFRVPLDIPQAADVLAVDKVQRVSAMVEEGFPPIEIPEPIAGASRASVFTQANALLRVAGQNGKELTGAVVFAPKDQLMALASNPAVFAVEALPTDAAWGRFGVRPVVVE